MNWEEEETINIKEKSGQNMIKRLNEYFFLFLSFLFISYPYFLLIFFLLIHFSLVVTRHGLSREWGVSGILSPFDVNTLSNNFLNKTTGSSVYCQSRIYLFTLESETFSRVLNFANPPPEKIFVRGGYKCYYARWSSRPTIKIGWILLNSSDRSNNRNTG